MKISEFLRLLEFFYENYRNLVNISEYSRKLVIFFTKIIEFLRSIRKCHMTWEEEKWPIHKRRNENDEEKKTWTCRGSLLIPFIACHRRLYWEWNKLTTFERERGRETYILSVWGHCWIKKEANFYSCLLGLWLDYYCKWMGNAVAI